MGLWFFLSVAVCGHIFLKAYKLRMFARKSDDGSIRRLENEISILKKQVQEHNAKRIDALEEAVYFGDFELKKQFSKLEREANQKSI